MKRKLTSIIATTLIAGTILIPTQSFADDQQPISVYVGGQQLSFEVSPVLQDGTTLVPIRAIFEKLGLKVSWDSNTSTISGTKDGLNVQMQIGNTNASVNGKVIMLEVPPSIIDGNTLVPLRFVGEASGNDIAWDGTNRRIDVKSRGLVNAKVVSRAEVSRFLVRSLGLYDEQAQVNLMDVSVDNAYYRDIASSVRNGIVSPYDDGSFRPNGTIMRVEYAAILAKALNIPTSSSNLITNITIKDSNKIPLWAVDIVQAVINAGLMDLNEDGTFDGISPLKMAISEPNLKLKEMKAKYTTPTPSSSTIPAQTPIQQQPTISNKIDLVNQEYNRHTLALQILETNHNKAINYIEDKITSLQRSSIVGFYSDSEYNQKLTSLQSQQQAKQNLLNALTVDNSPEAATKRRQLSKDIADFDQQIKNLQEGRSAQLQIQALEDSEKLEDRDYQAKVQTENALYQSNLTNIH
jgi:hypothetical protein